MSELSRSAFDTHNASQRHSKQDFRVKDQRGRSPLVDADKNLYRALKVRHT